MREVNHRGAPLRCAILALNPTKSFLQDYKNHAAKMFNLQENFSDLTFKPKEQT